MKERIQKFLNNNLGFKLLSVFLASMLWLMVYNTEDPDVTRTFTCTATVVNAEAVTDQNKCYEIVNGSNVITFAVTAQRSVMDKLDETDFTLTADMNDLVMSTDETTGTVPVEMSVNSRYSSSVKFKSKNKKMEVSIEEMDSKQFIVTAATTGTVPEGYELGTVAVESPTVLKVSGPQSIVEAINQVVATIDVGIDVGGMSQNLVDNVIPVLYDSNGVEISTNRLTLSNSTVTISAKILGTKQVGLVYGWSGTPAGDSTVIGVKASLDSVMIKGTSAVLNTITNIEIPDTALNVNGAEGDITTIVDITEYLPEGAELVNSGDAQITLTALVETYSTKNLSIPVSKINVAGLESGCDISFEEAYVSVTIAGTDTNLEALSDENIQGTINVTDYEPGTYTVPVQLNLNTEKYTFATVHTVVTITDIEGTQSGAEDE